MWRYLVLPDITDASARLVQGLAHAPGEAGGAGGRLATLDGNFQHDLTLTPRIGLAASNEVLLTQWRAWIAGA